MSAPYVPAEVHHVNGDLSDNRPENLEIRVVCPHTCCQEYRTGPGARMKMEFHLLDHGAFQPTFGPLFHGGTCGDLDCPVDADTLRETA